MFFSFLRRGEPDRGRTRIPAERKFIPGQQTPRAPAEPERERPWWKEMLGIGTKREWILIVVGLLLFAAYTYEHEGARQALWAFTTAISGLLIGRWWTKRNEEESGQTREPVLGLGEPGRDESAPRD